MHFIAYLYLNFLVKINDFLTSMLCKFLQYLKKQFAHGYFKKLLSKVAHFKAQFEIFSTANRTKSHILFHKNGSPLDFYIMTLPALRHSSHLPSYKWQHSVAFPSFFQYFSMLDINRDHFELPDLEVFHKPPL